MAFLAVQPSAPVGGKYLSPTGSDSNDGSVGSPWLSLAHASTQLTTPGDTLYCRGGTYTDEDDRFTASASGTAGNPITVRNYPGETPVFRAFKTPFQLDLYDWYHIEGIEIRPNNSSTRYLVTWSVMSLSNCDNCVIRNCKAIGNTLTEGDDNGLYTWGYAPFYLRGTNIEVDGCTITHCGDPTDPAGNSGVLIFVSGVSNKVRIHNCTLSHGVHDNITVYAGAQNVELVNNTHVDAVGYCVNVEPNGAGPVVVQGNSMAGSATGPILYEKSPIVDAGDDTIYRYNSLFNSNKYGVDFWQESSGRRFFNNVIYNMGSNAIIFLSVTVTDIKFFNNVIAHNMAIDDWYVGTQKSGEITNNNTGDSWPDNRDLIFENNFIVCYVSDAWEDDYEYAVYDELYVRRKISWMEANRSNWSNNIYNYADPKFTDAANGDFSIAAGSSLINAGRDLTTVTSATGSGTDVVVEDARFFWFSEFGSNGDQIIIDGDAGKVREITAINYGTNTLTLDSSVSWTVGDSVNVYKTFYDDTVKYSGSVPDIGPHEYIA